MDGSPGRDGMGRPRKRGRSGRGAMSPRELDHHPGRPLAGEVGERVPGHGLEGPEEGGAWREGRSIPRAAPVSRGPAIRRR